MSTQRTANIFITNATGGDASIILFHKNSSNGLQNKTWSAKKDETVGPMIANFKTGFGAFTIMDYWSILVRVQNGPSPGTYVCNTGGLGDAQWYKECMLQGKDADKNLTFTVSTTEFTINEASGACKGNMTKVAPFAPISNVFVVMLENHSFDNILAMSGIAGITAATTQDSNSYTDSTKRTTTYNVKDGAPQSMPTDPGHEFEDVVEQLAGAGVTYPPGGPYPPINNSGFASNYATTKSEGSPPPASGICNIMACFDTVKQLPITYQLATEFAVCDHWFSSLPGPTWPNRFFIHGASSCGIDYSPTSPQIAKWELPLEGFAYPKNSIYDALKEAGMRYKLYADKENQFSDEGNKGSFMGAIPQVSSLKGISIFDVDSLKDFADDLQNPYPYTYTFIEPNYGNVTSNYEGGSSQHPMDDVYGGEELLKYVYESIRKSPLWDTSLLIITYDEHGGFYDSVAPVVAPAPNDGSGNGKKHGFDFTTYGVRVPAIIVSPLIKKRTVDKNIYDHSSVIATLRHFFGVKPLTERDGKANNLSGIVNLASPRADCPLELDAKPIQMKAARKTIRSEAEQANFMEQPLPDHGNLNGFLHIMLKTEFELSGGKESDKRRILENYKKLKTRNHAKEYITTVHGAVNKRKSKKKK